MKRAFLERIWSGLEIDRWIASHGYKLLRCRFNHKGAVVLYRE